MKNLLALLLLSLALSCPHLKAQQFEFGYTFGNHYAEASWAIHTDAQNNTFVTSDFKGTIDFDPDSNQTKIDSADNGSVAIQKFNANGQLLWQKSFGHKAAYGTHGLAWCQDITTDPQGNIYLCGQFNGPVDFNPGPGEDTLIAQVGTDGFVLKLDSLGNFIWVRDFAGGVYINPYRIRVNHLGTVQVAGEHKGDINFAPSQGTMFTHSPAFSWETSAFAVAITSLGTVIWGHSIGSNPQSSTKMRLRDMEVDTAGNVILAGEYDSRVDLDPGPGTFLSQGNGRDDGDLFILKLDINGNFVWADTLGHGDHHDLRDIHIKPNGHILAYGNTTASIDMDPGPGTHWLHPISGDAFFAEYDAAGQFHSLHTLASSQAFVRANRITTNQQGDYFISGRYNGNLDFDMSANQFYLSTTSLQEYFILKTDDQFNFQWARPFGSIDLRFNGFSADNNGGVYLSGYIEDSVNLDFIGQSAPRVPSGNSDFFFAKLGHCAPYERTDSVNVCKEYRWINNTTYTASNNSAKLTYIANNGCDSIIHLDLQIRNVSDTTISLSGDSLVSNASNAQYQWLDVSQNYAPIPGANQRSFGPGGNGHFAVALYENNCTDTSETYLLTNFNLKEVDPGSIPQIFPNPSSGPISITFNQPQKQGRIEIYSLSGQLLNQFEFQAQKEIPVQLNGPVGLYLLRITNEKDQSFTRKISLY